jgi:hypothetical protein
MGNYTSSHRLNWVVTIDNDTYHVALQYNPLSGWREVFIDSKCVSTGYDRSFSDIPLLFASGEEGRLRLTNNQYKIVLADGRQVSDLLSSFPKVKVLGWAFVFVCILID